MNHLLILENVQKNKFKKSHTCNFKIMSREETLFFSWLWPHFQVYYKTNDTHKLSETQFVRRKKNHNNIYIYVVSLRKILQSVCFYVSLNNHITNHIHAIFLTFKAKLHWSTCLIDMKFMTVKSSYYSMNVTWTQVRQKIFCIFNFGKCMYYYVDG